MKRTAIIILTLLYTISSFGMSVERFYCCGKLAHTTYAIGDSGSKETKAVKADNCCKTTKQSFKVKDNHVGVKALMLQSNTFVASLPERHGLVSFVVITISPLSYQANAPPGRQRTPAYILHCNYRI